jgi:hypothetical protein
MLDLETEDNKDRTELLVAVGRAMSMDLMIGEL